MKSHELSGNLRGRGKDLCKELEGEQTGSHLPQPLSTIPVSTCWERGLWQVLGAFSLANYTVHWLALQSKSKVHIQGTMFYTAFWNFLQKEFRINEGSISRDPFLFDSYHKLPSIEKQKLFLNICALPTSWESSLPLLRYNRDGEQYMVKKGGPPGLIEQAWVNVLNIKGVVKKNGIHSLPWKADISWIITIILDITVKFQILLVRTICFHTWDMKHF